MDAHEMHETHEKIVGHGEGGHGKGHTVAIAIMISLLAAMLALVETGAKGAQTEALEANIEAANLWSFFQAKTVRMTVLNSLAEALEAMEPPGLPDDRAAVWNKRITDWKATADRYDEDPQTGEGRKELAEKAKHAEEKRNHSLAAYHMYEIGAGALQIAIVLASAAVVTGIVVLAWLAGGLGVIGGVLGLIGMIAPTLFH